MAVAVAVYGMSHPRANIQGLECNVLRCMPFRLVLVGYFVHVVRVKSGSWPLTYVVILCSVPQLLFYLNMFCFGQM